MENPSIDIKKVAPRLGGYHYEFQVGALRLLDLIEGKVDKVEFESASDTDDYFDDIKVFHDDQIHHYQVKWGLKTKKIGLGDFVNMSSNLHLPKLFQTWKLYSEKSPSQKHIFHVYSSKKTDDGDKLLQYLVPCNDEEKIFSDNKDNSYKLKSEIYTMIKPDIHQTNPIENPTPYDMVSFFDSLIIEINQPNMPINEEEEKQIGNPIQNILLEKISNRLGLDKFPNILRPIDVLNSLIIESYDSAIQRRFLTREDLAAKIGIKLRLDSISQNFSFDDKHYIKTPMYLEELTSKFNKASGELIGIVGLPGTGKSHLLTFWKDTLYKSGIKPIAYYCFIEHENHPNVRITQNQLLQDLINNILNNYSDLGSKENHSLLAATPQRLENILSKLGEYARSKDQTIPIIIDGLDHIGRTREKYSEILSNQMDILDFLNDLNIPEGITIVIGSQPGSHLTELKNRFGHDNFIEIKGFTPEESKNYFSKFKITDDVVSDDVINSVIEKSGGLPLLLAYSVHANREISFETRLEIFKNVSKELPKTNGDVKIYYDWLWSSISSKPFTHHCARLLSLIDFPASNDLLEKSLSKSLRLGNSLDECLKPLIPVSMITEEGTSFFHDSFGTYVRSDDNFSADDRKWYFKNMYRYFDGVGLHSDDLAYSKGIDFAFKAQLYDEILNVVSLDFIDNSMLMAFPQEQILSHIDFAIRSAVHTRKIPILVRNCALRKYTKERFESNYPSNKIIQLFIKLKKDVQVKRLIFSNNSLNTTLATTIDLLSLCLENNIELSYTEILNHWENKIKEDCDGVKNDLKSIKRLNYAKVISHVYGLEYTLNWIKKNKDIDFDENIFEAIGKFSSCDDVKLLIQKSEYDYGELIIILNSILNTGDKKKALEILSNVFSKKQFFTPYMIEIGIKLGIEPSVIENECKIFVPRQPSGYQSTGEVSEFYEFKKVVRCLSYCEKTNDLKTIIETIKNYPLTTPRLLQEMMFLLSVTEGKIYSGKSVVSESENFISELDRFVNHSTSSGVSPRDVDCVQLQSVANHILTKMVRVYLRISDSPDLAKLMSIILKLNKKFEWYLSGMDLILVSTEHMISCLFELINRYPTNNEIKQKIIQIIDKTKIPTLTSSRVDYLLNIAQVYLTCGSKEKAEIAFTNAIKSTHAYGYRKDLFLDEINDIAINLNMKNPQKSLERAADILDIVKYLWEVTDHTETKYIPGNVTKELLRTKSSAGLKLLKQFKEEKFELPYVACLPFTIQEMKNTPLSLRWSLIQNKSCERSSYDDKNWLMEMKFELVEQAIDQNQDHLAKEIMENIRNQIVNEFTFCEKKWEKDFKIHAKHLEISSLNLSETSSTNSYLTDSTKPKSDIFKDGSVKEIIEQFKKLDGKQYSDADKNIELIFGTKIKTMNESELDELTVFLSKEPRGIFNSTCGNLLAQVALRYEGQNDEKFLKTMFSAFDTYGWFGYGYPNIISWLVNTYNKNSQKTMDFVIESFTRFSVEKYGPHGSIRRLSEFLYLTDQIDLLEEVYHVLYDFCKTFFRTYTKEFNEFHWLRGSNFETIDDEEIIQELIKMV